MIKKEYFITAGKYLRLDINVDYQNILKEAINLREKFIDHKSKPYPHKGWKSICLHGLSELHIDTWGDYGFKTAEEAGNASVWTNITNLCPHTMNFLENFPSKKFGRIRFEMIEAGGFISEHRESKVPVLENILIPLNNPDGYSYIWDNEDELHLRPGFVYTTNVYYFHKLINNSNEDRYYLIVDRHDSTDQWKELLTNSATSQGIEGEFISHEIAT